MFRGVEGGVLCNFMGLPRWRKVSGRTVTSSGGPLKSLHGDQVHAAPFTHLDSFPGAALARE